jgi:hypothetical protein
MSTAIASKNLYELLGPCSARRSKYGSLEIRLLIPHISSQATRRTKILIVHPTHQSRSSTSPFSAPESVMAPSQRPTRSAHLQVDVEQEMVRDFGCDAQLGHNVPLVPMRTSKDCRIYVLTWFCRRRSEQPRAGRPSRAQQR